MVCVPCFAIPVLLVIFRLVVQPLVYRIWGYYLQEPALSCPLPQKKTSKKKEDNIVNNSEECDETNTANLGESSKDR